MLWYRGELKHMETKLDCGCYGTVQYMYGTGICIVGKFHGGLRGYEGRRLM
jgi:hypothetical protein